jgi:hypothetical protein
MVIIAYLLFYFQFFVPSMWAGQIRGIGRKRPGFFLRIREIFGKYAYGATVNFP